MGERRPLFVKIIALEKQADNCEFVKLDATEIAHQTTMEVASLEVKTANQITRSNGKVELHVIDLMNVRADALLIARTANVVTSRLEVPLSS